MLKKIINLIIWLWINWYEYWSKALTILGDIKISKYPFWFLYQPEEYKIKGDDIRKIISVLEPGDILCHNYNDYLVSKLIPGSYSHGAIYIGDNKLIEAVAEGVREADIIDFCRCDRVKIFRPVSGQEKAIERVKRWVGKNYDLTFQSLNDSYYCWELCAEAYKELDPQKYAIQFMMKEIKCLGTKYIYDTFDSNMNFRPVLEIK